MLFPLYSWWLYIVTFRILNPLQWYLGIEIFEPVFKAQDDCIQVSNVKQKFGINHTTWPYLHKDANQIFQDGGAKLCGYPFYGWNSLLGHIQDKAYSQVQPFLSKSDLG